MALRASTVTVTGAAPIQIISAASSEDGVHLSLSVAGATVYFGGDDMTAGNYLTHSLDVAAGGGLDDVVLMYGDALWAYVPSGTGTVKYLASGV